MIVDLAEKDTLRLREGGRGSIAQRGAILGERVSELIAGMTDMSPDPTEMNNRKKAQVVERVPAHKGRTGTEGTRPEGL